MSDDTTPEEVDPLEALKAEHAKEVADLKAQAKNYAKETAETHRVEYSELKGKLEEAVKGSNTLAKKAARASMPDWMEQAARLVEGLPASWAPSMVAAKIRDPKFQHPFGYADFLADVDECGNVHRVDGELVPA